MTIAVWLGAAPPLRTIRWLDGVLHATAKFLRVDDPPPVLAVAAGDSTWLDLAADRASRAGIPAAIRAHAVAARFQSEYPARDLG